VRFVVITALLLANVAISPAAVTLDSLGKYLTRHGYGGAQLAHPENFYFLPFQSNGKPGNFLVDTGSPTSLIFRANLSQLGLSETKTTFRASGAFGKSTEAYGLTTIKALTTGNCTLTNVPATVAPGTADTPFYRSHSNGLLGLRELVAFGAFLDLGHRLIYLRPSRPSADVSTEISSILLREGYTAVPFSLTNYHLRAAGALDGRPCYFVIDTGGYITLLDADFARRAKLNIRATRLTAESFGVRTQLGMAISRSIRIGPYEIRNASASIGHLTPAVIGHTSDVAGILGVEYLATNSAIFDFVGGKMYLRPRLPPRTRSGKVTKRRILGPA
jgi:predicted aspartyl protease